MAVEPDAVTGRRSPPTERVVAVARPTWSPGPERRFGLSELARALEMSKPTCLGILTALVGGGYLTRDPEAKYRPRPALIVAGRAAQRGFAVGPHRRGRTWTRWPRSSARCTASAVVGDQVMILEVAAPPGSRPDAPWPRSGQVYPFAPAGRADVRAVETTTRTSRGGWVREPAFPVVLDRDLLQSACVDDCREIGLPRRAPHPDRAYGCSR